MRKIIVVFVLATFLNTIFAVNKVEIELTNKDNSIEKILINLEFNENNVATLRLPMGSFADTVKYVDIYPDFAKANVGDDGYFISSYGELVKFLPRNGGKSFGHWKNIMPIHGSKTPAGTYMTHVRGMPFAYTYVVRKPADMHYMNYTRFDLEKNPQYEDIVLDFIKFPDNATYCDMAKYYRNWRIKNHKLKPLKEKIKTRPELAYCIGAPEVRIMIGQKPHPTQVEEQTPETEPPMKLLNSFESVGLLLDAMKANGVEKAQVCLVGWNQKGHDGRYPQLFPVEESAGGEAELRKLIKKGQEYGYQMTCHTCPTDGYSIANCWNEEYVAKNQDGSLRSHTVYSGGRMYDLCLQRWYQVFAKKDLKAIAQLGFRGLHYLDVVTAIYPYECFDNNHKMTPTQGVKWAKKIFKTTRKHLGGAYSEGGIDFAFDTVDGCIWVYPDFWISWKSELVDELIPFWQIVYNGIVLSTPSNKWQHPDGPNSEATLRFFEFGGRPRCEFAPALNLNPPEKRIKIADEYGKKMKRICDEFKLVSRLQLEFIDDHKLLAPDVTLTKRNDGTTIICNRSNAPFKYGKDEIATHSYKIYEQNNPNN